MMSSHHKRWAVRPVLILAILVASCSVQDATPSPSCAEGGSVLIAAQSVPSAQMLPCFTQLPLGWEVETVDITQDGTTIRFDSDRAGNQAAKLVFAESCDVTGAAEQPNEQDGVERFTLTEQVDPTLRARSFHVFDGGCATWTFEFGNDVPRTEINQLDATMVLVPRQVVGDDLVQTFVDREL